MGGKGRGRGEEGRGEEGREREGTNPPSPNPGSAAAIMKQLCSSDRQLPSSDEQHTLRTSFMLSKSDEVVISAYTLLPSCTAKRYFYYYKFIPATQRPISNTQAYFRTGLLVAP